MKCIFCFCLLIFLISCGINRPTSKPFLTKTYRFSGNDLEELVILHSSGIFEYKSRMGIVSIAGVGNWEYSSNHKIKLTHAPSFHRTGLFVVPDPSFKLPYIRINIYPVGFATEIFSGRIWAFSNGLVKDSLFESSPIEFNLRSIDSMKLSFYITEFNYVNEQKDCRSFDVYVNSNGVASLRDSLVSFGKVNQFRLYFHGKKFKRIAD